MIRGMPVGTVCDPDTSTGTAAAAAAAVQQNAIRSADCGYIKQQARAATPREQCKQTYLQVLLLFVHQSAAAAHAKHNRKVNVGTALELTQHGSSPRGSCVLWRGGGGGGGEGGGGCGGGGSGGHCPRAKNCSRAGGTPQPPNQSLL
jgi:hypothetical protein